MDSSRENIEIVELSQRLARTFVSRKEIDILELSTSFTVFRLAKRIEIVGLSTDSSLENN